MLGSFEDAEDTVQETFLRAWRRRETFEGRSTFRAWLPATTSARHSAGRIHQLRQEHARKPSLLDRLERAGLA